jgi:hypothetical protein
MAPQAGGVLQFSLNKLRFEHGSKPAFKKKPLTDTKHGVNVDAPVQACGSTDTGFLVIVPVAAPDLHEPEVVVDILSLDSLIDMVKHAPFEGPELYARRDTVCCCSDG